MASHRRRLYYQISFTRCEKIRHSDFHLHFCLIMCGCDPQLGGQPDIVGGPRGGPGLSYTLPLILLRQSLPELGKFDKEQSDTMCSNLHAFSIWSHLVVPNTEENLELHGNVECNRLLFFATSHFCFSSHIHPQRAFPVGFVLKQVTCTMSMV